MRESLEAGWKMWNVWVNGEQRPEVILAATQGDTPSIADVRRWSLLFMHLVSCANFAGERIGCVPLGTCVEAFFIFLGGRRWRAAKEFWRA